VSCGCEEPLQERDEVGLMVLNCSSSSARNCDVEEACTCLILSPGKLDQEF
jgi:hypothetical protein